MPVRDPSDGPGEPEVDREERAPAGGARFFRGRAWVIAGVGLLLVIVYSAVRGTGQGDDTGSGEGDSGEESPPDEATDPTEPGATVTVDPAEAAATTVTTLTPPDVAHERPEVDLETVPALTDPVEVARWYAAAYSAYVGAEAPDVLADRLAPVTDPTQLQTLRDVPPAASYDAPAEIVGVIGNEVASGAGTRIVRVTVETVAAVVVYDVTLDESPPGSWLVSQAVRV